MKEQENIVYVGLMNEDVLQLHINLGRNDLHYKSSSIIERQTPREEDLFRIMEGDQFIHRGYSPTHHVFASFTYIHYTGRHLGIRLDFLLEMVW